MNRTQIRALILIFSVVWAVYAIAANYATVWTADDYARAAVGQPPSTFLVVDAGWPIPFVKESYSLARPIVTFEVDYGKIATNLFLIVVVQLAVIFLAWDATVLTIRHLLLITATAAVAATLARSAANRFGGTATSYFVLFAYLAPIALASVRLLFHSIVGALWFVRLTAARSDRTIG